MEKGAAEPPGRNGGAIREEVSGLTMLDAAVLGGGGAAAAGCGARTSLDELRSSDD